MNHAIPGKRCCGTCRHMPDKYGSAYLYCPILLAMESEFPDEEYRVCGHHVPRRGLTEEE